MRPQYPEIVTKCTECDLRSKHFLCELSSETIEAFDAITTSNLYPKGAVLFVEGQPPRGIYVLCRGRIKLSMSSSDGKTITLRIIQPGEVIGLSATVSNLPYPVTAETLEPCQANFARREDFLELMRQQSDLCFGVARHVSERYQSAFVRIRSVGLSNTAVEKLANLLLEWCNGNTNGHVITAGNGNGNGSGIANVHGNGNGNGSGLNADEGVRLKLSLTHQEIASMIGTSRETVSRAFGEFKSRQLIEMKGSNLTIRNKAGLRAIASD
jgi:CRP/FNR family transcriptional regulator